MAKKSKSLVRRLIDKFMGRLEKKSPEEQLAAQLAAVQGALRAELAVLLAAALFAKKTLDTTRQVETPFPDAYFSGQTPVDDGGRAALAAYAAALEQFQVALVERDTTPSLAVAKGLTTLIVSLHAMSIPGLLPQGREMWARLAEAGEGVEEGHKFLLRREPSDIERTYFAYRPRFLASPPD
ncbi:MAG: hypothetical protein EXQ84_02000 [Rhodospirillaceae bacterium]|nr:hypothetical protein [Rhodospirillaceae bacterium]